MWENHVTHVIVTSHWNSLFSPTLEIIRPEGQKEEEGCVREGSKMIQQTQATILLKDAT